MAVALAAGPAHAQSASASAKSTKTSQSAKSAAKPAKISAASKAAPSKTKAATASKVAVGKTAAAAKGTGKRLQKGAASWYGPGFHGRRTANGERFDMYELTAAHRTLPLGTRIRVVNPDNGKEVVVRINDRGPYAHNRILDLSKAAASKLGLIQRGHGDVVLHALRDDLGDGQGLTTTRVAADSNKQGLSPTQAQQAEVLAKTRFGDSSQVLGNASEAAHDAVAARNDTNWGGESARSLPAGVMPAVGLAASQGGLGFDVARASAFGLPWGRTEWERVQAEGGIRMAAQPAGLDTSVLAASPAADESVVVPAASFTGMATAAAMASGSVAPVPRVNVPSAWVLPVVHAQEAPATEAVAADVTHSDEQPALGVGD